MAGYAGSIDDDEDKRGEFMRQVLVALIAAVAGAVIAHYLAKRRR